MLACFLLSTTLYSQEKCASVPYQKELKSKFPQLESKLKFENWLSSKIEQRQLNQRNNQRQELELLTIPVVVHVIHSGEAIGVGKNISSGQIHSQIDVLNEDFRRNNSDASSTPAVFMPVAADIEIEFVLAKRDPEGLPTNGILRAEGPQQQYRLSEQYLMKSLSYWPSDDYLNIWVTDIGDNFVGYAQFPISTLAGLENSSNYALTDGVAIDYRAFGSEVKFPPANLNSSYNLGRTTTHEVGHFLGLRHIWGDSNICGEDDFCNDTPQATTSHNGLSNCTFPTTINGCGSNDMFQNYMDYTNDACMNLFTLDQKSRMRTVLENSPRRNSLLTSKGGQAPIIVSDDLGIRNIITPKSTECSNTLTPIITVRNYGSNNISTFDIGIKVDGVIMDTITTNNQLSNLEIDTIYFSELTVGQSGYFEITYEIVSVNGIDDNNIDNNLKVVNTFIPEKSILPVIVDFESTPTKWQTQNNDELFTWEIVNATNVDTNNKALSINYFDYEQQGELDYFSSPAIDISSALSAALSFDVAYAQFGSVNDEGLLITITSSCDEITPKVDTIYTKFGNELSTTNNTSSKFTPQSAADWRTELIDLTSYVGSESVIISFVGLNNFGNALYIDNISIVSKDEPDISLLGVSSPSIVSCKENPDLKVNILNSGVIPISSFEMQYAIDGGNIITKSWEESEALLLGDEVNLSITLPELSLGKHTIEVSVLNPNGMEELNTMNNYLVHNFVINDNTDTPPIKEQFENFSNSLWLIANPDEDKTWEITNVTGDKAITLNGNNYANKNEEDWLVSPSLDFSNLEKALLNFNLAYAKSTKGVESLKILVSTDCGNNYQSVVFDKSGGELATTEMIENFIPMHDSVWRNEEVDLSNLIGQSDVRIAFVSTNNNGNNIYLDDIQLYVTDHDNIALNTMYPNPSEGEPVNLTFDLASKEDITIYVYDRMGKIILKDEKPKTLNQTYTLDISNEDEGIYLVKVIGQTFSFVKRLYNTGKE